MNQLQVFKNELFEVGAKLEGDTVLFDVEQVAKCLGITEQKGHREYVMWRRVNKYLFGTCAENQNSPQVGKGDLIPEPMVYKLAFKASNEVAEQFQDWLAVEVIPQIRKTGSYSIDTSKLSPELQMFNQLFLSVAETQLKQQEQDKRLNEMEQQQLEIKQQQENIKEIVALNPTEWRKKTTAILNKIAIARGGFGEFKNVRQESYDLLESRARCKLDIRLNNRKKEALANGILSKSKIEKMSKLDVIADDARLTEIYIAIVKEMAIKYQVDIEGLGA